MIVKIFNFDEKEEQRQSRNLIFVKKSEQAIYSLLRRIEFIAVGDTVITNY